MGVSDVIIRDYKQSQMDLEEGEQEAQRQKRQDESRLRGLKEAFKQAGEQVEPGQALLKVKSKSRKQVEDERTALERIARDKARPEDRDILQDFWADDSKLDDVDKYLRNYLLTKGWIDRSNSRPQYG